MKYYIYGDIIPMHTVTTSPYYSTKVRHRIPADEIQAAYPKTDMVKLFKTEEDSLNY